MPPSYQKPTACPPFARALIVGESNPYSRDPDDALLPWPPQSAGARLRSLLGWTEDEYLASFWRANLICGARWTQAEARVAAISWAAEATQHELDVVMLGARVASAFHWTLPTWEKSEKMASLGMVRVPHPSGLCREWTVPGARDRLRRLMEPYRVTSCAPRTDVREVAR